jgi:hypothetical protein
MSPMASYSLWVLEPASPPGDALWQNRPVWSRVEVIATSEAFARLAAEQWAENGHIANNGNESAHYMAGFKDDRLYAARQQPLDPEATIPARGSGLVITAEPLTAA